MRRWATAAAWLAFFVVGPAGAERVAQGAALEVEDGCFPNLEAALRQLQRAMREGGEENIEDAVLDAGIISAQFTGLPSVCQSTARAFIAELEAVVLGPYSSNLRRQAFGMLGWVAMSGVVTLKDVQRIFSVCERAVAHGEASVASVLLTLDAVGQSAVADVATLEAILDLAGRLVQMAEGEGSYRFLYDAMALFSRLVSRLTGDDRALAKVVRAAGKAIKATEGIFGSDALHRVILHMLGGILPLASGDAILVEFLGVAEACVANFWGAPELPDRAADMLQVVAAGVSEEHLGRVVAICAERKMFERPAMLRAVNLVVKRLLERGVRLDGAQRVQILARGMTMQHGAEGYMPCRRAIDLLVELPPPQDSFGLAAALARTAAATSRPLPVELAMRLQDYVGPSEDALARMQIVRLCAARAEDDREAAGALLRGACLRPWRVGLGAARAYTAIARAPGAPAEAPEEFAAVGARLLRSVRTSARAGGRLDLDAEGTTRIAAELLRGAHDVLARWPPRRRRGALRALCGVAGHEGGGCRAAPQRLAP